jgi:hypothetical protein
MAKGIPARLTPAQGRRFGLTVGGAFLVLAAVAWWRGHGTTMAVLAALGGTLSVAGLLVPTYLGPVERAWMRLAHLISRVTTPVVMAVMYYVVLTPVGILRRLVSRNPLVHAHADAGFWKIRPADRRRTGSMERQF